LTFTVVYSVITLATTVGGKHRNPVKNSPYHCMTFSPLVAICFVYDKPKVKFMHSSNHTEQYRK